MTTEEFRILVSEGIPDSLPEPKLFDPNVNHAPKRKDILTPEEISSGVRISLRFGA
jgi:urocanate hydratase